MDMGEGTPPQIQSHALADANGKSSFEKGHPGGDRRQHHEERDQLKDATRVVPEHTFVHDMPGEQCRHDYQHRFQQYKEREAYEAAAKGSSAFGDPKPCARCPVMWASLPVVHRLSFRVPRLARLTAAVGNDVRGGSRRPALIRISQSLSRRC
ncbi:hypothetical protein JCM4914_34600 [Streptomyces platensis subsp. malvinus]